MNDPFNLQQYNFNTPPRFWKTDSFPVDPVDPQTLIQAVCSKLESYGNVIPSKTPQMVTELCKGFNECIRLNQVGEMPQTIIFSPKTGSAKSTTAKAYISLLREISSLVIVPRVEDAIQYCRDINEWSGDSNYARSYYKITDINPNCEVRIDREHINNYKCIVITHAMLRIISKYSSTSVADALREIPRDLVIVDERLSLFQTYEISEQEIDELIVYLSRIRNVDPDELDIILKPLHFVKDIIDQLKIIGSEKSQKIIPANWDLTDQLEREDNYFTDINFQPIRSMVTAKNLKSTQLSTIFMTSDIIDENAKNRILEKIASIEYILRNEFYCFKSGAYTKLISNENLRHSFGSIIVLDATADINQIYTTRSKAQHMEVMHMETTDPRIYTNLNIHVALGYNQSRDAIFKNMSKNEQEEAKKYLQIAKSLLINENDKLLIITYKIFREHMERHNTESKIEFTHWGNHVGKNEWSHCNKVLIIGWHHLTEDIHYNNFIHAVGSQELSDSLMDEETLKSYKISQMADDLVQAAMRCSARRTIDIDGNCVPSEIYLFRPDTNEGKDIALLFAKEFQGATVQRWIPTYGEIVPKQSKSNDNADIIIEFLKEKAKSAIDVNMKTIIHESGLKSYTVSRTTNSTYFKKRLEEEGFQEHHYDKKTKGFLLKK